MRVVSMKVNTGIDKKSRQRVAEHLSVALADSYLLLLKTHYYHWNVTGPHFQALHLLFEAQYNALFMAVDGIAERIRALGFTAPGTYREYGKLSSIKEDAALPESWQAMAQNLVEAHESVARKLHEAIAYAAEAGDDATADLLTGRLADHEKTAWMLRSHLE